MATARQERRATDASRAYRVSRAAVVVSFLALGWQIYQSWSQKHNYEKEFGNIETSLRLLTASVAPQLQQAIDDSLKATLSEPTSELTQTSQALAKVENDTINLRKLKAKLPPQNVSQTASLLERAVNLHSNTTSAWGAAAQMVSYRSDLRSEPTKQPDCYATQRIGGWHSADMVMRYHDCTLNLDAIAEFNAIAPRMWQPGNIEYENAE